MPKTSSKLFNINITCIFSTGMINIRRRPILRIRGEKNIDFRRGKSLQYFMRLLGLIDIDYSAELSWLWGKFSSWTEEVAHTPSLNFLRRLHSLAPCINSEETTEWVLETNGVNLKAVGYFTCTYSNSCMEILNVLGNVLAIGGAGRIRRAGFTSIDMQCPQCMFLFPY